MEKNIKEISNDKESYRKIMKKKKRNEFHIKTEEQNKG